MDRPLEDVRPIGPFMAQNNDVSEFHQVEVQRNDSSEEHTYTVAGVFNPGGAETVGMVVKADALEVNYVTAFALESPGDRAIFTATGTDSVGIVDNSPELAIIEVK